jgi:hypothetical protein
LEESDRIYVKFVFAHAIPSQFEVYKGLRLNKQFDDPDEPCCCPLYSKETLLTGTLQYTHDAYRNAACIMEFKFLWEAVFFENNKAAQTSLGAGLATTTPFLPTAP